MKQILSYLSIALLFAACSQAPKTIDGQLENATEGSIIYLEEITLEGLQKVDSSNIEAGQFSFEHAPNTTGFYRISQGKDNFCMLVLGPENQIRLQADANNLNHSFEANGSPEVEANTELVQIISQVQGKTDSLSQLYQQSLGTAEAERILVEIRSYYDQMMLEQQKRIEAFIDSHPGNFVNLIAVQQLGSASDNIQYFKKVSEELSSKYPDNQWVIDFKKSVDAATNTAIGALAPDFTLNNTTGEAVSLSDYRGKIVLLDFWASWCGPCRRENPNVVSLYQQYNHKGFEVLGVSLDGKRSGADPKAAWLKAIEQDQLSWANLSDLQGFESPIAKLYGIQSIPSTFLIDAEGIIIARNLRGTELDHKLAALFD